LNLNFFFSKGVEFNLKIKSNYVNHVIKTNSIQSTYTTYIYIDFNLEFGTRTIFKTINNDKT